MTTAQRWSQPCHILYSYIHSDIIIYMITAFEKDGIRLCHGLSLIDDHYNYKNHDRWRNIRVYKHTAVHMGIYVMLVSLFIMCFCSSNIYICLLSNELGEIISTYKMILCTLFWLYIFINGYDIHRTESGLEHLLTWGRTG